MYPLPGLPRVGEGAIGNVRLLRARDVGGRLLRLASEIGRDHRGVIGDGLRRTVRNLATEIEHSNLPADAHHQPHVVIDQ